MEQIVYAGGTAGLIAYLLYTVYQFGSGNWQPKANVDKAELATAKALGLGEQATTAVEEMTVRLDKALGIIDVLLAERKGRPRS